MRLNGYIQVLVGIPFFYFLFMINLSLIGWIALFIVLTLLLGIVVQIIIPSIYLFWDTETKRLMWAVSREQNVNKCTHCGKYKNIIMSISDQATGREVNIARYCEECANKIHKPTKPIVVE
jgi:hypothetical protein